METFMHFWNAVNFRINGLLDVGFEVFTAVVMKSIIFWDMTPCSLLGFNRRFGGTYRLQLQGRRNRFSKPASSAEPISSTLKMEAICSFETSVETQRTTRRHIPEDYTLHCFILFAFRSKLNNTRTYSSCYIVY
jgi:hypothetical protein